MRTEVVVGDAAIRACAFRAALTARTTVRVVRGTGVLTTAADAMRTVDANVQLLVCAEALDGARITPEPGGQRRAGDRVRFLRGAHPSLVIVDDELALLPTVVEASEPACLCVVGQDLVRGMSLLFDALWAGAWELTPRGTGDDGQLLDEQDVQVLALVVAGVKDETIARQLGMGSRTVQRRISAMSQRMGARSRLDLVRTAMELGLG